MQFALLKLGFQHSRSSGRMSDKGTVVGDLSEQYGLRLIEVVLNRHVSATDVPLAFCLRARCYKELCFD